MIELVILGGSVLVVIAATFSAFKSGSFIPCLLAVAFIFLNLFALIPWAHRLDINLSKMSEVTVADLKNVSPETVASLKADGIHPLSLYGMLRTVRDDMHEIRINTECENDRPDEF